MKKSEFIKQLNYELSFLPSSESDKALLYYGELVDDAMDSGLSEEEAVSKLPLPAVIARELRSESIANSGFQATHFEAPPQKDVHKHNEPVQESFEQAKPVEQSKLAKLKSMSKKINAGLVFKIIGIFFFCVIVVPILIGVAAAIFGCFIAFWASAGAITLAGVVIPLAAIAIWIMSESAAIFLAYLGGGLLLFALGLVLIRFLLPLTKALWKFIKRLFKFGRKRERA